MAETHLNLTISLLLCFFFLATSAAAAEHQNPAIRDAIEALSDSGFSSMSIQLERISKSLQHISKTSPLTIFAPTDSAFQDSDQPAHLLYYHLCPLKIPSRRLPTLPSGTKIPTFFSSTPLIVTSSPPDPNTPRQILLNGVPVNRTAVFDSGPVVIYAVNQFLDPFFQFLPIPTPPRKPRCQFPTRFDDMLAMTTAMFRKDYNLMSGLIDWQLANPLDQPRLTVFAPADDSLNIMHELDDYRDFGSFFRRHVVPCRLSSEDLWDHVRTGIPLPTFLDGYTINVTKSGENLVLNGVVMEHGDVHNTVLIATHGIARMLELRRTRVVDDPLSDEYRSVLAQYGVLAGDTLDAGSGIVGQLRDLRDCYASHIRKLPNETWAVAGYPACVDLKEVSRFTFHDSSLNTAKPSSFSKDQSQKKVHFNCATQSADFRLAKDAVKAVGDSFMSAFFDMQLTEPGYHNPLTVLMPIEDIEKPHWLRYYLQSLQHLIPCRLTWSDLVSLEEGQAYPTFYPPMFNFRVKVTKVDNTLLLNKVPVIYPDLYTSKTLVIHGIKSKLPYEASKVIEVLGAMGRWP